ncbi:mucin-4-like isoform X3 [Biomphalaria glabrata]|uniref:Mucin-4-like isoform X3 n=1 Tax=Biomphalaria glabrata TaxID=6526 RepID=A0A9W2YX17_BIOGL|nr:mucin-4-like isoform X3 [Biomphalaria glabrata]
MISSKSRRAAKTGEKHQSAVPRPSDVAKKIATGPSWNPALSPSYVYGRASPQVPPSSSNYHASVPTPYFEPEHPVHNPYDDLNLYAAQINAVHRPAPNASEPQMSSRVQKSSNPQGSYYSYGRPQQPPDPSYYYRYHNRQIPPDASTFAYYGYGNPAQHQAPTTSHGLNTGHGLHSAVSERGYVMKSPESYEPSYHKTSLSSSHDHLARPLCQDYKVPSPNGNYPKSNNQQAFSGAGRARSVEPIYRSQVDPFEPSSSGKHNLIYVGHVFGGDADQRMTTGYGQSQGRSRDHEIATSFLSSDGQPSYSQSRQVIKDRSSSGRSRLDSPKTRASYRQAQDESLTDINPQLPNDQSFLTSTPKRRPVPPPNFDNWSSIDSSSGHRSRDALLRLKFDEPNSSQERSQSMSPKSDDSWFRNSRSHEVKSDTEPLYCDVPMEDRASSRSPLSVKDREADSKFSKSASKGKSSNVLNSPGHHSGLAATLNYHQQLRKELGMPQPQQTPTYSYSSPIYGVPVSNIITPLPNSSDGCLSSDTSPASPTSKQHFDPQGSSRYEASLKKYYEAFQSLHGHCSTPHLPSATLSQFEQPLSGSDPNLRSDLNQQSKQFPYYDNLANHRNRPQEKSGYPYVTQTLPLSLQYNSATLQSQSRPSKSSSSLLTSSATAIPSFYHHSDGHYFDRPSPSTSPLSTASAPSSIKPVDYPLSSVHGFCTVPRNLQLSQSPNSIYSLQRREPSYEEIENITPYKQNTSPNLDPSKHSPAGHDHKQDSKLNQSSSSSNQSSSFNSIHKETASSNDSSVTDSLNSPGDNLPATRPEDSSKTKKCIFGSVSEKAHLFEQGATTHKNKDYGKESKLFGKFKFIEKNKTSKNSPSDAKQTSSSMEVESKVEKSTSAASLSAVPATSSSSSLSVSSFVTSSPSGTGRMSNPEEITHDVTMRDRGLNSRAMTSSLHETGSVDVEAINDFLMTSCTYPYHLFSRRKKPLPDLDTSPEYARMISEAERSRSSCGSNDGSVSSTGSSQSKSLASPGTPTSPAPGDGNDDFLNKVCKFEMISRVKSPTIKSPGVKSPTSKTPNSKVFSQDGKKPSPTSPFGTQAFIGEKVFTRDTATTRVSASLLQGLSTDRVHSTGSTISSNSLTSVSTLSWNSDASDTSAGSAKGRSSAGKDIMTTSDPGGGHSSHSLDSSPSSASNTYTKESLSNLAHGGGKRGGIIDLSTSSAPTISSSPSSTFPPQQQPSGTTKKFITLSSTDKDFSPAPVVKPLQPSSSGFPYIKPNTSPETKDNASPALVNGNPLNRDSGGSGKHRNTFEGMDFELNELPGHQQALALKHREVVAERKMEQEREKKDKQRLDEILRMCEEYQNEVTYDTSPHHTSPASKQFSFTDQSHPQPSQNQQQSNFTRKIQPPGPLELHLETTSSPVSSLDRRERSGNMTKIKTNGSLMLNSPNNPHKEFGPLNVQPGGIYASKMETTSSAYSSNSEDETVGTSEDTGTIKKRPNVPETSPTHKQEQLHNKRRQPGASAPSAASAPHLKIGQNAITMTADISQDNIIVTTTNNFAEHVTVTLPDQHEAEFTTPSPKNAFEKHPSPRPQISNNVLTPEHKSKEPVNKTSTLDSALTIHNTTVSSQGHVQSHQNLPETEHGLEIPPEEATELPEENFSSSRSATVSSEWEPGPFVKESHSSTSSSSQTLREVSNHSSRTSSLSSSNMDVKEDTPTPVNSDSEHGDVRPSNIEPLSPRNAEIFSGWSTGSLGAKEECQLRGQLEGLRLTKTQLLVKIAEIRRQIAEIELQESEAVRELDLETKLLEGEHREQMNQLQAEQERITEMKRRQQETLAAALREREKEQRIIELERQKLLALEEEQHELNARILQSSTAGSGSVNSGALIMDEETAAVRLRLQQELECQRRLFDDLEFQQLEAEARFETEKEQINNRLMAQQAELLGKYKDREERLQQIDVQQKKMLSSVKSNLETLKEKRLELGESYKKEKSNVAHCDKKIGEISKALAVPLPDEKANSDDEMEMNMNAHTPSYSQHQRFIDSSGNSIELRRPLDLSLDSSSGSFTLGPNGEVLRKKSATLLEIERNRSLFIEQQANLIFSAGSMIIDQERKRIEELRRRAADEGRAQWEERRRVAEETSRLQLDERRLREVNCKSFNSLESEDSSVTSSCDTPSEKETSLSGDVVEQSVYLRLITIASS